MGSADRDFTTPSWLFIIAAVSFVADVVVDYMLLGDTLRVEAFIDSVDDGYLLYMIMGAIMGACSLWWLAQFFVEPYLFLKSFPRYFSQGSKKSKLLLALAQLALVITWIMCYRIMAIIAERC